MVPSHHYLYKLTAITIIIIIIIIHIPTIPISPLVKLVVKASDTREGLDDNISYQPGKYHLLQLAYMLAHVL